MRTRIALIAALAAGLSGLAVAPASASCYPQKPQTCEPCRITGISTEGDIPRIEWQC